MDGEATNGEGYAGGEENRCGEPVTDRVATGAGVSLVNGVAGSKEAA